MMVELIERLEAASEGSRELDRAIWREAVNRSGFLTPDEKEGYPNVPARIKPYTTSLDAAMTLIPDSEGVGWRMTDGAGGPTAEIWRLDLDNGGTTVWEVGANPTATPALALCSAALRALSSDAQDGQGEGV